MKISYHPWNDEFLRKIDGLGKLPRGENIHYFDKVRDFDRGSKW